MAATGAEQIKEVNARYHDVAAGDYDRKWGISYSEIGHELVASKLAKALGGHHDKFERTLEVGAGTGYFSLNLALAGVVREAVATDISQGMLNELGRSASRLGVRIETRRCEADQLPFPDSSFDLVFGHAVLHHVPDLDSAFAEFHRVLRPGGRIAFCGEPSKRGDRIARLPKLAALRLAPAWRRLVGAGPRVDRFADLEEAAEHGLEHVVDVHAFTPRQLETIARRAGFGELRTSGEELVAGWFGWANRTLESTADARTIPHAWHLYAYYGYRLLKALDDTLFEPRLPPAIFYNLLISGRVAEQAPDTRRSAPGAISLPDLRPNGQVLAAAR